MACRETSELLYLEHSPRYSLREVGSPPSQDLQISEWLSSSALGWLLLQEEPAMRSPRGELRGLYQVKHALLLCSMQNQGRSELVAFIIHFSKSCLGN